MGSGLITCTACNRVYADKWGTCIHCGGKGDHVASPGALSPTLLVGIIVFGFCALILIGVKGCSDAMNAADLKKLDADIAKTDAENQSAAVTMGVTVADYMAAKADSDRAYAACKVAAEGRAKHDYKADFFPNSTWAVKNRVISLVGRDLQMQNGFGVYGRVSYFCDWSMDAQMVTSLHLSED